MFTENPEDFIYNSSIGIHVVSPAGIIIYANECELDVLGYKEGEYIGHHVSEFQIDSVCLADMMKLNTLFITRAFTKKITNLCIRAVMVLR